NDGALYFRNKEAPTGGAKDGSCRADTLAHDRVANSERLDGPERGRWPQTRGFLESPSGADGRRLEESTATPATREMDALVQTRRALRRKRKTGCRTESTRSDGCATDGRESAR